jgi:hypothetical protein
MSIHAVIDNGILAIAEKLGRMVTKKELCKKIHWKGLPSVKISPEIIDVAMERLRGQGKFIKDGTSYRIANPRLGRSVIFKK